MFCSFVRQDRYTHIYFDFEVYITSWTLFDVQFDSPSGCKNEGHFSPSWLSFTFSKTSLRSVSQSVRQTDRQVFTSSCTTNLSPRLTLQSQDSPKAVWGVQSVQVMKCSSFQVLIGHVCCQYSRCPVCNHSMYTYVTLCCQQCGLYKECPQRGSRATWVSHKLPVETQKMLALSDVLTHFVKKGTHTLLKLTCRCVDKREKSWNKLRKTVLLYSRVQLEIAMPGKSSWMPCTP